MKKGLCCPEVFVRRVIKFMGLLFIWVVCVEGVLVLDSKAAVAGTSVTRHPVPQEDLNKKSRGGSVRVVGVSPNP